MVRELQRDELCANSDGAEVTNSQRANRVDIDAKRGPGRTRTVLITGAATGIGRAAALRLDAAGWKVFAGVLNEREAEELDKAAGGALEPLLLDITDPDQIVAAAVRVGTERGGLDGLVNNAGIAVPGPLETMPIEYFRRQIEVNLIGQVAVTQAMLAAVRTATGRVVFIGSFGGRVTYGLIGAYSAAKHGIEAVGDAFRQELRPWGISVSIIEPGTVATPIYEAGERTAAETVALSPEIDRLYGPVMDKYRKGLQAIASSGEGVPAETVAKSIEHALSARRPRGRYLPGVELNGKAQIWLKSFLPTPIFDRMIAR